MHARPPRAFAVATALVAIAATLAACGGSSEAPLPALDSATAERVIIDGEAQTASTVKVRFASAFKLVEERLPLESLFEVDIPDPEDLDSGNTITVLVQEAEVSAGNRTVTLEIAALVPDGSTVKVAERAFRKGAQGKLEIEVESDINELQAALATTAFAIADPVLLARDKSIAPTAADRDTAAMESLLIDHMSARAEPDEAIDLAVGRYRAIPVEVVASPKLRAALAALTNTFADPAIASYMTPNNCTGKAVSRIAFEPPPDFPNLYARVTYAADGARIVSINPNLEGERLERLMPILAHEAIHCDDEDPVTEEIASTAIDTFLYMHLIPLLPDMVFDGTPLTREYNVDVVAFLNSGRLLPESGGILPSASVGQALPGTTSTAGSFAELVAAAYREFPQGRSPDEDTLQAYVRNIAATVGMPEGSGFDLVYLDELLSRALDPRVLVLVVEALGLEPVSGG